MFNLAHTSTGELKTKSGAYKVETSNHYEERLGFHEVGFLTGKIGDGEFFFFFGSVLNEENEEKRMLEFCSAFFFFSCGQVSWSLAWQREDIFYIKKQISQECRKTQIFLGIKLLI